MENSQMKEGRFLRWHKARSLYNRITAHLNAGGDVLVCTYARATKYSRKHVAMFKATKAGCLVQAGKRWDCIDYCGIKFI